MLTNLRLLIAEDSKIDATLILDELKTSGFNLISKRVETPEDFKSALTQESWDVVCCDYMMPHFSALAALEILQQSGQDIPFIIISGSIGEELAVQALHKGASDYLMKDNLARLPSSIKKEVEGVAKRRILKKTEDLLKETENSYRRLVEVVTDYGIFMIDPKGNVLSWNIGAQRITGYNAEEIIGKSCGAFFTPEGLKNNQPEQEMKTALAGGRYEAETEMRRKDGGVFVSHTVVIPVYGDKGVLTGYSKILRDITERRLADEKIKRLTDELEQRVIERTSELERVNRDLESFTHSVSHDLKAPIRQLVTLSESLLAHMPENMVDQKGQEYLGFIIEASRKALSLVNALLELSGVTSADLHPKRVDLTQLATEIADKYKHAEPKRHVDFEISNNMSVSGDPDLIRIALQNLLDNAWKFTSKQAVAHIQVASKQEDGKTVFFIRDDGAGFNPVHKEKLFQAFQRLHTEEEFPGTGIGLATVQRIVHRHGGEIWAEGTVDHGVTVSFTLPVSPDK